MIDLSEDRHAPAAQPAIPPPPDDTARRKQQEIAAISPHRLKRVHQLNEAGRDPGAISRTLSIPVSTVVMILNNPEMIASMRNNPMNLGEVGALAQDVLGEKRSYSPGLLEKLGT